MQIARVIGTVVATQKHRKFEGAKLLLVQPLNLDDTPRGTAMLAIDGVGAGVHEKVLVVLEGRAAGEARSAGRPRPSMPQSSASLTRSIARHWRISHRRDGRRTARAGARMRSPDTGGRSRTSPAGSAGEKGRGILVHAGRDVARPCQPRTVAARARRRRRWRLASSNRAFDCNHCGYCLVLRALAGRLLKMSAT